MEGTRLKDNEYIETDNMKRSFAYPLLVLLAASCVEGNKAYDASGVFESTEVTVSAEGNGKILSLDLQEGDRLEAGQIVGCIDTVQLHLSEIQLEASRRAVGSWKARSANSGRSWTDSRNWRRPEPLTASRSRTSRRRSRPLSASWPPRRRA